MSATTVKLAVWSLVGLAIAAVATTLQFRHSFADPAAFAWAANGARWVLAMSVGALLASAGCALPARATVPQTWLGFSAGTALGAALAWRYLGPFGAAVAGPLSGVAFALAADRCRGTYVIALTAAAFAGVGVFAASLVKFDPNLGRSLAFWALGDLSHASWEAAALGLIAALAYLALRHRFSPYLALGVGVGLAGPLSFVAWWVPRAEDRLAGLSGRARVVLCALAGGVLVMTVDAAQRFLVGGYGLGLNLPLTMLGLPFLLWWGRARVAATAVALFAAAFSYYAVNIIRSAT